MWFGPVIEEAANVCYGVYYIRGVNPKELKEDGDLKIIYLRW